MSDLDRQVACLAAGLYHTACSLGNQTCLCDDPVYNDWVTNCVTSNCTVRDQLCKLCPDAQDTDNLTCRLIDTHSMIATQAATKFGCGVVPTQNFGSFMVPEIIVFVSSTLFFLLRLGNRFSRMAPWGWDDTTCAIAWVCRPGSTSKTEWSTPFSDGCPRYYVLVS